MAGLPRKKCLNVYHVLVKGINLQATFKDDNDRDCFMEILRILRVRSSIVIYGYCLMDNHVHLLLEDRRESVFQIVEHLIYSYTAWYNKKYDRTGNLFHSRLESDTVESIWTFLKVLRYVHQDPIKAGLALDVLQRKWTSMQEYVSKPLIIEPNEVIRLFAANEDKARRLFTDFMLLNNNDEFLDIGKKSVRGDQDVS